MVPVAGRCLRIGALRPSSPLGGGSQRCLFRMLDGLGINRLRQHDAIGSGRELEGLDAEWLAVSPGRIAALRAFSNPDRQIAFRRLRRAELVGGLAVGQNASAAGHGKRRRRRPLGFARVSCHGRPAGDGHAPKSVITCAFAIDRCTRPAATVVGDGASLSRGHVDVIFLLSRGLCCPSMSGLLLGSPPLSLNSKLRAVGTCRRADAISSRQLDERAC